MVCVRQVVNFIVTCQVIRVFCCYSGYFGGAVFSCLSITSGGGGGGGGEADNGTLVHNGLFWCSFTLYK